MATREMTRPLGFPVFEEFFKPWNDWFEKSSLLGKMTTVPPVNIIENEDSYVLSLAVPGMKKDDFKISLEGLMLTISTEKEEEKEETEEKFTRREYNFYSFSRSFTLPEDVKPEYIEAKYEEGLLKIVLPRKDEVKRAAATKQIAVQ
ncbi:MAG TPA: Hsp20/alpha crystallin family protein [Flavisolibacter sp.]|jgi:HSP20 family protein|nr:Hsp20/alpha crystallin family protein [Flavisolibacter sp.]